MKVVRAESAGFCFGVNRAVNKVYELLESGKEVSTLGPIIHNPQLVDELKKKGVTICNLANEAEKGRILVIRSHGVTRDTIDELEKSGIEYCDATCPFVKKIHNIVQLNHRYN